VFDIGLPSLRSLGTPKLMRMACRGTGKRIICGDDAFKLLDQDEIDVGLRPART